LNILQNQIFRVTIRLLSAYRAPLGGMSGPSMIRIAVSVVSARQRPTLVTPAPNLTPAAAASSESDAAGAAKSDHRMLQMNRHKFEDWSSRWEKGMVAEQPSPYCTAH
jgi:hypothetical protein